MSLSRKVLCVALAAVGCEGAPPARRADASGVDLVTRDTIPLDMAEAESPASDVGVSEVGPEGDAGADGGADGGDAWHRADAPRVPPSAWVRVFDASFLMLPTALSVGDDGSVCAAGDFQGDLRLMGRAVTSSGASDGFAACFDPLGALRFLFASGLPGDDAFNAAAMSGDGFVVAGHTPGVASLSGFSVGGAGGVDVVLLHLDRGGAVLRAVSFGGGGTDQPSALAVDRRGHVFVAGQSDQDLRAGGISLRNEGRSMAWLVELDASLIPLRGRAFNSGFEAQPTALIVSPEGVVTLGGQFSGSLSTGGPVLGSTRAQDLFLIRIDAEGRTSWARRYGGGGDDRLHDLAVSDGGEVTLAGSSGLGRFAFGADEFDVVGTSDGWIARTDGAGGPRWSRRVGGDGEDRALSLFVTPLGAMAAGRFDRTLSIGDTRWSSAGAADAWRARFDEQGALQGVAQYGGDGPDVATRVRAAPGGSVTFGSFARRAVIAGESVQTLGIGGAFLHRAVE